MYLSSNPHTLLYTNFSQDFNVWAHSDDDLIAFATAILIDLGCVEKFRVPLPQLISFAKEVRAK